MKKAVELLLDLKDLGKQIKDLVASGSYKGELDSELKALSAKYKQVLAEEAKQKENGGNQMNKKKMKNQIFRAMLRGQDFTDEMKASGIELPQLLNSIPATGNAEGVAARGGYLVSEEFLDVDEFGGEVNRIPATDIPISKPSGKAPYFDREQAKAAGAFLATTEELTNITETHPVYGQLTFTAVDKYGIIPVSNQLIDDADFDVVAAAGECFSIAAAAQRNIDILAAVAGIEGITKVYAGANKTFEDLEAGKAINKAILSLKGANRRNATVVCSTDVWAKLANMTDKEGRPMLMQDINDPAVYRLYGVPVIEVEDDTTGKCYVGNFSRVAYFNRKGIEISVDYSAGFTKNAVLVKGGKRAVAMVREPGAFIAVCEGVAG